MQGKLRDYLEEKYLKFNQPGFIADDPICIPHRFVKKEDIEIAGFFAAILAWGQRKTIINNSQKLLKWMDDDPHRFILHHSENDLKPFGKFCHRTFNGTDTLYFIHFLKYVYSEFHSLEEVLVRGIHPDDETTENGLNVLRKLFTSLPEFPPRSGKHVASPDRKSACKRMNMFLRWMVRKDEQGVDFGIWKKIKAHQLVCPLDVHVEKVARRLGLVQRKQSDWLTAVELTLQLKKIDPVDPVRFDFALFGIGIEEKEMTF